MCIKETITENNMQNPFVEIRLLTVDVLLVTTLKEGKK